MCVCQTKKDIKETPNSTYSPIMTDLPPTTGAAINLVNYNCKKSNWRIRKCLCKKVKLYCRTLFPYSLDNDVLCENQELDDKGVVDTSDAED